MKKLLTLLLFTLIFSFNSSAEEYEITHKNGYIYEQGPLSVRIFPEKMSDIMTKKFRTGHSGINSKEGNKAMEEFVNIRKQIFSDERLQQIKLTMHNRPVMDFYINMKTRNIDYLRIRMKSEDVDIFTKEELDKLFDMYIKFKHPYYFDKVLPVSGEGEDYYIVTGGI